MSHDQTWTSGQVLTAAAINDLTSGCVNIASVTANQTGITSVTDLTSLTITFTAIASRRYRIIGQALVQNGTTATRNDVQITDGSNTVVGVARIVCTTINQDHILHAEAIVTPGAGSVTYKLRGLCNSGTMQVSAAATTPAFITIEDFGST